MKQYCVYTDGSFGEDGLTHGGIVFINPVTQEALSKLHVFTSLKQFVSMRNVGGEILAAWSAVFSIVQGVVVNNSADVEEEVVIDLYFDYKGVGKWYTGKWQARKPATIWYRDNLNKLLAKLPNAKLNMHWVRGHVGNTFNEVADDVASYVNYMNKGINVVNMDDIVSENMKSD